jgi:hypothetical protein
MLEDKYVAHLADKERALTGILQIYWIGAGHYFYDCDRYVQPPPTGKDVGSD